MRKTDIITMSNIPFYIQIKIKLNKNFYFNFFPCHRQFVRVCIYFPNLNESFYVLIMTNKICGLIVILCPKSISCVNLSDELFGVYHSVFPNCFTRYYRNTSTHFNKIILNLSFWSLNEIKFRYLGL